MRHSILLLLIFILLSCKTEEKSQKLKPGAYRAEIKVSETELLPFVFELSADDKIKVINAEEVIEVDDVQYKGDSIFIKMPVFEGFLAAKVESNTLSGSFIKAELDRRVPFSAKMNNKRFETSSKPQANISGTWETVFSPDDLKNKYVAKGDFKQEGHIITGTFRTETGDYRYLEGVMDGNEMKLSTFDGAHAFLFTAEVTDSTMTGVFYSGDHWKEPFKAIRNSKYELPSANSLTFLNEGYDSLEFTFPDASGKQISLSDEQFKNKVVLVQIMGTWCPNCLDESRYYADFYKSNKAKGVEFIALAFEYVKTEEKAFHNIKRLQDRVGIDYPILLAQTGTSSKSKAQEKLPMLNHVLSYPTTVFIDKTGKVRKIHTGFNGPATGEKFTDFKMEFEGFVNELLDE